MSNLSPRENPPAYAALASAAATALLIKYAPDLPGEVVVLVGATVAGVIGWVAQRFTAPKSDLLDHG